MCNYPKERGYFLKTMAIIGAGPGLGFSLAKTFGKHGFRIALVSRSQDKLNQYAEQLNGMGIESKGFAADVTNKMQLTAAFQQIRNTFGTIDVVEFSPHNGNFRLVQVYHLNNMLCYTLFC